MLDTLTNIEFSSRLLLGALYRQYQYNPVNYIYESMGVRIRAMSRGDPECDLIRDYAQNTYDSGSNTWRWNNFNLKKVRVYKIDRKGEDEKFDEIKSIGNRKLLWHGSPVSNFLGIMS